MGWWLLRTTCPSFYISVTYIVTQSDTDSRPPGIRQSSGPLGSSMSRGNVIFYRHSALTKMSGLINAARSGETTAVRALIAAGANVNQTGDEKLTKIVQFSSSSKD